MSRMCSWIQLRKIQLHNGETWPRTSLRYSTQSSQVKIQSMWSLARHNMVILCSKHRIRTSAKHNIGEENTNVPGKVLFSINRTICTEHDDGSEDAMVRCLAIQTRWHSLLMLLDAKRSVGRLFSGWWCMLCIGYHIHMVGAYTTRLSTYNYYGPGECAL